ncbi:NADH:flavin oxidoreductase/NADH oxidase family protein [Bacillus thuringiensis]|uniref:NADH:flavin oxidoreductase/NADH oxidase family protein n=1 Tax=Bacillus thuringiensis TaxID=1428 RepID=UPI0020C29B94|nr:NADH:flavin oxidoreductase/NADH oxidase family protein [Bacillus thuringiensis]
MSELFKPLTLNNNMIIKNRFFKAAMSENMATKDHNPTDRLVSLYKKWAQGGTGLLITGNVMVDRMALGELGNVVVDEKTDKTKLRQWAAAGKVNSTHIWMQLNHPGKQSPSVLTKKPVAPSAIPLSGSMANYFNTPRELTNDEILEIIKKFGTSARIAKETGFTGIQIHGAHGYLVSQFLSPLHNQRQDEWGGSITNRIKFLTDIYLEIRKNVGPNFPISLKLNSADFQRGGFTEEESMTVLSTMSNLGVDLIEISGGSYEKPAFLDNQSDSSKAREGYFLKYAQKAKEIVKVPLVVTGGFRSIDGMLEAIKSGNTDMVGLAKPLALCVDLPNQIKNKTYKTIETPKIKTGIKKVDDSVVMLEIGWYEIQLDRISRGLEPDPNYSPWLAIFKFIFKNGKSTFQKRRM